MLRIGQKVADINLKTTAGDLGVHEYFQNRWGLVISYVSDFSAVCTDELSRLVKDFHKFETRGIKILAMSCDPIDSHIKWIEDIKKISEIGSDEQFPFPIVSDQKRMLSMYLNILDAKCKDENGLPLPCRATFVLAPDKTIQLIHFYSQTTGRNFDEILRSIDALQLTYEFSNDIFTPSGWKPVTDCLVPSKVSKDDAKKKFPFLITMDLPSGKDYMRIIPGKEIEKNYKK